MAEISYKKKLSKLFSKSYVESNKNHDEALDVYEKYCSVKKCKLPVLVNYDSHIDVHIGEKLRYPNTAQWVNYCFSRFGVTEYYWLLPNYMKDRNTKPIESEADYIGLNIKQFTQYPMLYSPATHKLIDRKMFDATNDKMKKYGLPEFKLEDENLIPVMINILPFKELSILKDKEIALSVDADAFSNTGYDTKENENNSYITSAELKEEFETFIDGLYDNNLKISAVSLTRSPGYFPDKYENEILEFFNDIKNASEGI